MGEGRERKERGREVGKGREGREGRESKGGKGSDKAPKLLLNQGPSEPCYTPLNTGIG